MTRSGEPCSQHLRCHDTPAHDYLMTNTATRVKGHRRTVRAVGTHTQGMFTVASAYVGGCSCGWSSDELSHANKAAEAHAAHKADVIAGTYDRKVEAERARRLAQYQELIADMDANGEKSRGLTREQVQRWIDELPTKRIDA